MKKKHYDKILVVILVMIMVFSSVATAFASSVNVTYNGNIFSYTASGGKPAENLHSTFTTSDGKPVYCAEHGIPSPIGSIGSSLELNKQEYDNAQVRKILYYGYQGIEPWWGFSDPIYNRVYQIGFIGNVSQSKTQSCGIAVTSMALTRAYGGNGRVYEISGLSAFESYIADKPDPKANGFKAYLLPSNNGYSQDLFTWEYYPKGYAKVKKTNASNSHLVAECPEHYSLAGAKYGIYESEANANGDIKRLATLTTDADGNSDVVTISAGTYYVKEVQAPKGYILDRTVYPVTVTSGQTSTVSTADEPRFDPLNIKVTKKPVEGSDKNLSIEGAEYTVKYYKQLTDGNGNKLTTAAQLKNLKPYRTWVIKTNKNGIAALGENYLVKEKSDPLFKNEYGDAVGLHGTYSIEETLAPAGFAKTDTVWVQQASFDSKLQHIESQLEDITDNEKPQTISITINKVDAETGKNEAQGYGLLAGAKYDVFFFDPVKSEDIKVATLTTDERGFARYEGGKPGLYKVVETKASNGYIIDKEYKEVRARLTEVNTANFDYVVTSKEKPINVEVEKTSIDENGVKVQVVGAELQLLDKDKNIIETFTSKKKAHVIKGLKPGKYYIHEVKAPEGYFPMEKDIEFEVKATEEVQNIEVFNEPTPEIKTAAAFSDGTKNHKKGNDLVVIDKFSYKKVIAGEKYLVKGKLIDKATGKAVCETSKEFTPNKAKGSVNVNFKFDASKYDKGAEFVVTEQLYRIKNDKTEKLVATHEDLTDLNQTVNIPSLKTTATDKEDGNKNLITGKNQVIKDKVYYNNLYAGKEYTVSGVLMNKATNKPILVDGKEITAEKKFTAKEKSGYVELEFKLDTSSLKGETVVVFENLYEKGIEVGTHADINDIEQTTFVPELKTTATDKINDGKDLNGAEKQTIVDKVEYKSLYPGKEYTMHGILMDKATGKAIIDNGKEVTAETTFTPSSTNGTVTLEFSLNASALKGKTIVVFERLYEDGKELAIHTDINDVDQSVYIPKVKTKATFDDGSKNAKPSKDMSVVDVFSYENAIKNQKYIVKGELIDKATGKAISKGETKFTAKFANGDVNVEFKFDGSKYKEGAELVVTEKLYSIFNGKEKLVASHVDLDDTKQTVNIPKLKTTANDGEDGNKNLITGKNQVIKDKVYYNNLYAGKEYTVSGVLMNKATGKPILVGGKEITAEKKFTAKEKSGYVELEFTFDASALKGETIVVFEHLYEKGIEVGTHADINDIEQTTFVPALKTTATDKINDGKDLNGAEKQTIVDKVEYKSLYPGKAYTVKGILMDKATGKAILDNGKEVTAEKTFTAEKKDGTVTLEFSLNADALKGKTIVVFEKLYEDGKELAIHADINDVDQSMYIPKVKTSASFANDNKNSKPAEKMIVTDVFSFENLIKDQKYILKGELINKATGEVVTKAEKEFTAKKVDGDISLDFEFDGKLYAENGAELVVTEKLYSVFNGKEKLVASHVDIGDLNQTVNIPKLKTTATDKVDNGKDLNGNVKQTIVDRVEYKNLYAGKEYTVKGVLMNKATNKPILVDGKEITAEKKFTPEKTSGFVELEFTFDSSALKGETIVVFEKLYEDKIEVAVHTDINDKDQSVYIPEIKTTATSQDDGTKSFLPVNTVVVSDKVEYKNLIKGQMYEMSGTLVNTKTKEIVAKASGCFVCESEDGFVTLDFEFDATGLKGKDVVAFEELYKLDKNGDRVKEVAEHADITDKGQTVKIENPEIKTTATFDDGAKKNTASKDMTIIDKVQYKNLVVGKEYTVKGILMNKATNKPFTVDGKEITGELTFTAEKSEGFVELEYKFDGTGLKKTELVVFENLYYKDQEIAAHNDITDEGQAVKIVPPGTVIFEFDGGNNNDNVKTGDEANLMLYTMLLLGSILVIAIIMSARKRANK